MKNIEVIEGDITTAKVDAVVNAANPKMLGGGGVDGAIHRAAGPKLLEACNKVKPINGIRCPFGEARITDSGDLPSKYVIHAVGPIYRQEGNPKKVLEAAYYNSLVLAKENSCSSIAFPAISCGAYGYPPEDAAYISVSTCSRLEFSEMKVFFYLFGDRMCEFWREALSAKN